MTEQNHFKNPISIFWLVFKSCMNVGEMESRWIIMNYISNDRFEGEILTSSYFIKRKTVNSISILFHFCAWKGTYLCKQNTEEIFISKNKFKLISNNVQFLLKLYHTMAQNISPNMQYSTILKVLYWLQELCYHPISTFLQRGRFILKIVFKFFSLYLAIFLHLPTHLKLEP